MTNSYYNPTGTPTFLSRAQSAQPRNESTLVSAGFDKLPSPSNLSGSAQNYVVDTGMVNALVVTVNSNIVAPYDGMELVIKAKNAPTGASTILAGSFPIAAILRQDGSPIQTNDWLTGQIFTLRYDSARSAYQYTPPYTGVATISAPLSDASPIAKNAADPSKLLKFNLAGITTGTTRTVTFVDKDFTVGPNTVTRSTHTSNSIIVFNDNSTLIDITSGTFTQTFTAAATLGSGFWLYIRNSGTGDITLDPNGGELIDGLTSYIMYPGECRLVQCDGIGFNTIVINAYYKSFTSSGTYTKPPGYKTHSGVIWNAGSSGEKSSGAASARGGAGAGAYPFNIKDSSIGASETVTIGAGGVAVTAASTVGNIGGFSSFGSLIIGVAAAAFQNGAGFYGVSTNSNILGFEGTQAVATPTINPIWGGSAPSSDGTANSSNSVWGGAAGGSVSAAPTARNGGTSKFGGNGGNGGGAVSGNPGIQPGGGGGATQTGTQSGAGAAGQLDIWGVV